MLQKFVLTTNALYSRREPGDWQGGSPALENQSNQIQPISGRVRVRAI